MKTLGVKDRISAGFLTDFAWFAIERFSETGLNCHEKQTRNPINQIDQTNERTNERFTMTTRRQAQKQASSSSSSNSQDRAAEKQPEQDNENSFNLAMPQGIEQLETFAQMMSGMTSFFRGFEQEKARVDAIMAHQAKELALLRAEVAESGKRAREEAAEMQEEIKRLKTEVSELTKEKDTLKQNVRVLCNTSRTIARDAIDQFKHGIQTALDAHQQGANQVSNARMMEAFREVIEIDDDEEEEEV